MADQEMEQLLEQSIKTDFNVLLTAKEKAKRAVLDDPNPTNLAALERATRLVEAAMQAKASLKNYRAVLAYAEENMRKIGKSKLFEDIKKGKLKRQPDGSFKTKDVDRYLATLPYSGTPDPVYEGATARQRRKEEEEIRRIKATADKEEFLLSVQKGKFVPKEKVHLELAARAISLSNGLKTAFEAKSLDLVACIDGNPKKAVSLVEMLESILDEAFNEYSREMEITVELEDMGEEGGEVLQENE